MSRITLIAGIFLLIFPGVVAISLAAEGEEKKGWISGYNSDDGGLTQSSFQAKRRRIYTLRDIQKLRRAVSPRYIRLIDWKRYGQTRKIINRGILFTYAGYRARRVFLAGNFSNWKNIAMYRNDMGVYYYILPVKELEEGLRFNRPEYSYKYKFLVDGIWQYDPGNKNRLEDGLGSYLSIFRLHGEDIDRQISVHLVKEKKVGKERLVEFAIYLPAVNNLSLVGTFNDWNPEHDLLQKGEDGIFRLRLRLKPGEYVYKYIADGRWILDKYNPLTRYFREIDELCSYLVTK